jgi:hypothetical protein
MPYEQITTYLEAFKAFTEATNKAEAHLKAVADAAAKLAEWRKESPSHGDPALAALPDGNTIRQALEARERACSNLFAVWKTIPPSERVGLKPPPGMD